MPSGKKGKGRKAHRKNKPPGPLSSCKLPHDVVLNILSRLPVKTLLQFRCVCKPWRSLIRNPKFIHLHLLHHHHSAAAAASPSLLLHTLHKHSSINTLTVFSPLSSSLTESCHIPNDLLPNLQVVGTINGVVCLSLPPYDTNISLLNPATERCQLIQMEPDPDEYGWVSVGFGYQPEKNDYWIVRISNLKDEVEGGKPLVEVYFCNSKIGKEFLVNGPKIRLVNGKCDVIVNGIPYWLAVIDNGYGGRDGFVWFDVDNDSVCQAPLPDHELSDTDTKLVDWKGDVALLGLRREGSSGSAFVDVWMLKGDGDEWWSKKYVLGPISGMSCLVGCSRNGQIVGEDGEGNLTLYDCETGGIHGFGVDGKMEHKVGVFNFTESLVSIEEGDVYVPLENILSTNCKSKLRPGSRAKVKSKNKAVKWFMKTDGECTVEFHFRL